MKDEYITITINKEPKGYIKWKLFHIKVFLLKIILSPIIKIKYWYEE